MKIDISEDDEEKSTPVEAGWSTLSSCSCF